MSGRGTYNRAGEATSVETGDHVNSKYLLVAGVLALPVSGAVCAQQAEDGHDHGQRSPAVEAALADAIARVPQADYGTMKLTRHSVMTKSGVGESVEITNPVGMSVVVVLDENGAAHSQCVESAEPHVVAGSSRDPVK